MIIFFLQAHKHIRSLFVRVEKLVRDSVAAENNDRIRKIVDQLCHDYAYAVHQPYARNGGLIGLAAASIALGPVRISFFPLYLRLSLTNFLRRASHLTSSRSYLQSSPASTIKMLEFAIMHAKACTISSKHARLKYFHTLMKSLMQWPRYAFTTTLAQSEPYSAAPRDTDGICLCSLRLILSLQ